MADKKRTSSMGDRDQESSSVFGRGPSQTSSIAVLRDFVQRRYHVEQRFLDLSDIASDPVLQQHNILLINSRIPPVICKLASEVCPNVESLSLANNKLRNLQAWSQLPKFLSSLANLSLRDNSIGMFRDLFDHLDNAALPNLRELELINNPLLLNNARNKNLDKYRQSIATKYPTLWVLDGIPLENDKQSTTVASLLPIPVKSSFFESSTTMQTAQSFLGVYFTNYDNNRKTLHPIYHTDALLSITAIENPNARHQQLRQYNQTRNLKTIKETRLRFNRLHYGPQAIIQALSQLPTSKHVFDTDPTAYVVDAWQISLTGMSIPVMLISVHGPFTELEGSNQRKRHFDRIFTLVPSFPDSEATKQNIPFQITQDQLVVRAEMTDPLPWKGATITTPQVLGGVPSVVMPLKPDGMSDTDYQLVVHTMQQFGLTFEGAITCLTETQGNVQLIGELKRAGQIPLTLFSNPS